jgi:hypothetical protein
MLKLIWPLPALLTWLAAWGLFVALRLAGVPGWLAMALAALLGAAASALGGTPWRRVFIAAGFPLSLAASGAGSVLPAWAWLLPMLLLVALYPPHTWRDAPLFPTPEQALVGLAELAPLKPGAPIVDAGCGLGAGLMALHQQYPPAAITGWEWSGPLALACRWRCRFARVERADIWVRDWSGFDLVYLFQRPESMPRALAKAQAELRPGAWLVSLEFPIVGLAPTASLQRPGDKPVWLYRAPM